MTDEKSPGSGKMILKPMLKFSALVILVMGAASLWAYTQLPPDAQIPVHWGMDGEPDRYGGKFEALGAIPLVSLGLCLLLAVIPAIEPRGMNLARSRKPYMAVWAATLILMGVLHGAIILTAMGHSIQMGRVVLIGVGLLFVIVGNYLPKVQSNFMMGVRTPWTLSSERSWYKTHRAAGWVFVLTGAFMIVLGFVAPVGRLVLLPLFIMVPGILATVVYSWWVWRNDPNKAPRGS